MLLFSEESHMTSTYGKNRKVVNDGQARVSVMFLKKKKRKKRMNITGIKSKSMDRGGYVTDALVTFDVICDLLLNNPTATQNLFVHYLIRKSKCR